MLTNTFMHIQGIGPNTEQKFWENGALNWDDFTNSKALNLSPSRYSYIKDRLAESKQMLADTPEYFLDLLPAGQAWRIFPHFRNHSAYLDIETTAAYGFEQQITAITIYDGNKISCFVDGENLEDFEEAISRYKVLVTYNGKSFDAPIIEKHFRIKLPRAHIDLRYVLNHLGYSGGLKSCEKQLGMDRGLLEGVDGSFAIFLWEEFQRTGDRKALETLLAYNVADTVNLESLLIKAYNLNIEKTPFVQGQFIKDTIQPPSPYSPDPETVKKIKNDYFYR